MGWLPPACTSCPISPSRPLPDGAGRRPGGSFPTGAKSMGPRVCRCARAEVRPLGRALAAWSCRAGTRRPRRPRRSRTRAARRARAMTLRGERQHEDRDRDEQDGWPEDRGDEPQALHGGKHRGRWRNCRGAVEERGAGDAEKKDCRRHAGGRARDPVRLLPLGTRLAACSAFARRPVTRNVPIGPCAGAAAGPLRDTAHQRTVRP